MLKNVGTTDKIIRIVLGIVLISQVFIGLRSPIGWIGVLLLATAMINFCPVYSLLRIKTIKSVATSSESKRKAA
jgi:hypothetical protein